MIRNRNQLTVAKKKYEALVSAREQANGLERDVLAELARDIAIEISEYESIVAGSVTGFRFESIDDLGEVLAKVRLARGLTQRELAELLGVSEQMVQRDEASEYENAGIARVADAFDVLEYKVQGIVRPIEAEPAYFQFFNRDAVGYSWNIADNPEESSSLSMMAPGLHGGSDLRSAPENHSHGSSIELELV